MGFCFLILNSRASELPLNFLPATFSVFIIYKDEKPSNGSPGMIAFSVRGIRLPFELSARLNSSRFRH